MKEVRVAEIMTTDVVELNSKMTLCEATEIMTSKRVSGAPVVNDSGKLVGILSERDILEYAKCVEGTRFSCPTLSLLKVPYDEIIASEEVCKAYKNVGEAKVEDVMTEEVISVAPDTSLKDAVVAIVRYKVNRLPVVDKDKLVGVVARSDVLWAMVRDSVVESGEGQAVIAR